MPQIIVAGAAAWAGGAVAVGVGLTTGTLAYSLVSAGTAMIVSGALGDLLGLTPDAPTPTAVNPVPRNIGINVKSSVGPINIIYGNVTNAGGAIVYQGVNDSPGLDDNVFFDTVLAFGVGEVDAIRNVKIDGKDLSTELGGVVATIVEWPHIDFMPDERRTGLSITINDVEYQIEGDPSTADYDVNDLVTNINANKGAETFEIEAVTNSILSIRETDETKTLAVTNARQAVATNSELWLGQTSSSWDYYLTSIDKYRIARTSRVDRLWSGSPGWTFDVYYIESDSFNVRLLLPVIYEQAAITTGEYGGLYKLNTHTGASDQVVDSQAFNNIHGWTDTMHGAGVAYMYGRATFDEEKSKKIPTYTADIRGLKIKYWDTDAADWATGFNRNAAWVIRDYLTNAIYGVGIDEALIDDDSFKAAALTCDSSFYNIDGIDYFESELSLATTDLEEIQYVEGFVLHTDPTLAYSASSHTAILRGGLGVAAHTAYAQLLEFPTEKYIDFYNVENGASDGSDAFDTDRTVHAIFSGTGLFSGGSFYFGRWLVDAALEDSAFTHPRYNLTNSYAGRIKDNYRISYVVSSDATHTKDNDDVVVDFYDYTITSVPSYIDSETYTDGEVTLNVRVGESGIYTNYTLTGLTISAISCGVPDIISAVISKTRAKVLVNNTVVVNHVLGTPLNGQYYIRQYAKDYFITGIRLRESSGVKATIDGIVPITKRPFDNVKEMLLSCRGMLVHAGGVWQLKIDKKETSTVMDFEDNMLDNFVVNLPDSSKSFNRIKASFFNVHKDMQADVVVIDSQHIRETYHNNKVVEQTISFAYVDEIHKIRSLAMFAMKQALFQTSCSFTTFSEAMKIEVGDIVRITKSSMGWSNKWFRVLKVTLMPDGSVGIVCNEYSDDIYEVDSAHVDDKNFINDGGNIIVSPNSEGEAATTFIPSILVAPSGINFNLINNFSTGAIDLVLSYTYPDTSIVHSTVVEISGTDENGIAYAKETESRTLSATLGGISRGSVDVTLYCKSNKGRLSDRVKFNILTGATQLPAPTHLSLAPEETLSDIGNNSEQWSGKDCKIIWQPVSLTKAVEINNEEYNGADGNKDAEIFYIVEVYDSAENLIHKENASNESYTFTYEKNLETASGPHRDLVFKVYSASRNGLFETSKPAILGGQ